jgi:hypothetical protein
MNRPGLGLCHICGNHAKLSFEHVPPEAAFNDRRVLHTAFEAVLQSESLDNVRGKFQQRGAGAYTLCQKCNNDTGSWYGGAYADWAHQAMGIVVGTNGNPSLLYPFNIFPLRVLKQIICMFFSVKGTAFHAVNPDLVRFVLNKELRVFPASIRVYAFYTLSTRSRAAGVTGLLRGLGGTSTVIHTFSEVTFPPFGFVMTFNDSPPPEAGFCEISSFSRFGYQEWRDGISMRLPVMPIYTAFPGDYRTRERTLSDQAANIRAEAQLAGLG